MEIENYQRKNRIKLRVVTSTGLNLLCTANRSQKVKQLLPHIIKLYQQVKQDQGLLEQSIPCGKPYIKTVRKQEFLIAHSQLVGDIFDENDQIFCQICNDINFKTEELQKIIKSQQKLTGKLVKEQLKEKHQQKNPTKTKKIKKQKKLNNKQKLNINKNDKKQDKQSKQEKTILYNTVIQAKNKKKNKNKNKNKKALQAPKIPISNVNLIEKSKQLNLTKVNENKTQIKPSVSQQTIKQKTQNKETKSKPKKNKSKNKKKEVKIIEHFNLQKVNQNKIENKNKNKNQKKQTIPKQNISKPQISQEQLNKFRELMKASAIKKSK